MIRRELSPPEDIDSIPRKRESEDGQAPQPGHVPDATRGGSARARGPVLQIPRLSLAAPAYATQRLALDIQSRCDEAA